MARTNLAERIKQDLFILDGAMGTELFARGIGPGKCNDYLNVESPDIVSHVHQSYLNAGSDAVITNTFSANSITLLRHGLSDKAAQINEAAAQLARSAAGEDKYVLGNIGPSGDFLHPLGTLQPDTLKKAYEEQAHALAQGGVDGFIIETMLAIDELEVAVQGIKSVCGLPVFVSLAYNIAGDDFKTMMGVSVENAVEKILPLGIDAIGFNCGLMDMTDYTKLTETYVAAVADSDVVILAEPNAGQPELIDGKAVYKLSPEDFAAEAENIYSAGANIIGGCCGTTPAHIEAIAKKLS